MAAENGGRGRSEVKRQNEVVHDDGRGGGGGGEGGR